MTLWRVQQLTTSGPLREDRWDCRDYWAWELLFAFTTDAIFYGQTSLVGPPYAFVELQTGRYLSFRAKGRLGGF